MKYTHTVVRDVLSEAGTLEAQVTETLELDSDTDAGPVWEHWFNLGAFGGQE